MIVEKLPDEVFDEFLKSRSWPCRITEIHDRISLADAKWIDRRDGLVLIDMDYYGDFHFHDFDLYNCFYDGEHYTLGYIREINHEHNPEWIEFMSNHPVYGEEFKRLFAEQLAKEEAERKAKENVENSDEDTENE